MERDFNSRCVLPCFCLNDRNSRCINSSGRCLFPETNTNRAKASFIPSALLVFNKNDSGHQPYAEDDHFQSVLKQDQNTSKVQKNAYLLRHKHAVCQIWGNPLCPATKRHTQQVNGVKR